MKYPILFLFSAFVFIGCQDDEFEAIPNSYTPLSIGNYWVYEIYFITANGEESVLPYMDSVVITGDTMISGDQFFVFEGTSFTPALEFRDFRRHTGQYYISHENSVLYADTDTSILRVDSIGGGNLVVETSYQMQFQSQLISVPAGLFFTVDFVGTSRSDYNSPVPFPHAIHNRYALGVGKVLESTYLLSSGQCLERRLIRHSVQ